MDPNVWGPKAWFFIHNIALTYPRNPNSEDKKIYKNFFVTIGKVLPCNTCKSHYAENLIMSELDNGLKSNIDLFKWTVDMHNKVNKATHKRIISYEEAMNELNKHYMTDGIFTTTNIILFIIILILFSLLVYYYFIQK
jgi:hypothetical protein